MSKQTAWFLIIFLGAAGSLVFFDGGSGVVPAPKLLAQVGVAVGIAANPYNTLNTQLQQEQTELDKQAADLAARQAAFASSSGAATTATSPTVWYLSVAVIILGILVCFNFYLDWRRSRRVSDLIIKE
jgi:ABC-type Fe3+-siderophore transport system permease subunit